MTPLLLSILLFLLGLVILVVGSNLFVDTALRLAKRFRVPEIIIGATMVSFGTTLPEVMFSSTAAFHGHVDMAPVSYTHLDVYKRQSLYSMTPAQRKQARASIRLEYATTITLEDGYARTCKQSICLYL